MTVLTTIPATAAELFEALQEYGPGVEDGELALDHHPPAELLPAVQRLHSGVRAKLTGRQWWGSGTAKGKPVVAVLRLDEPLPSWVARVCVAGDLGWDSLAEPPAAPTRPLTPSPEYVPPTMNDALAEVSRLRDLIEALDIDRDGPRVRELREMVRSAIAANDPETIHRAAVEGRASLTASIGPGTCTQCGCSCAWTCKICRSCLDAGGG